MMNGIEQIIETVLDEHRDACTHSNPELAQAIAKVLIHKSLQQLAELTGGELLHDDDGQAVIYTSVYNRDYDRNAQRLTDPFELV
jgi:hypothetical protein